ncbi:MAG: hypothetical protein ACRBN8_14705 [Nannocystales bacterium]
MFGKTHNDKRSLNDLIDGITEEDLGLVLGGTNGGTADTGATPAPAPVAKKCKPGDPSCTDSTHPWGDW